MNNYHYIIAGIREQLSAHDRRLVDWLDFGTDTTHLSGHFYRAVSRQKSGFLKCYFDMDRKMRNAQVEFLSEKEGRDSGKYTVGETESYKEEFPELQAIFQCGDLFEREHRLDMFRWERITGMTLFHYFDMDVILAFLAKGLIVDRWSRLDKERGTQLFRQYVDEVRGTFKGVDFH